ncbi:MAG: hypothetical protein Q9202_001908 [Teloschistes flavicans]
MKPITIYWRNIAPNPAKVIIILEELGLPYQSKWLELEELKQPAFEKINPNGRLPAITDPNTNITLWETGAIIAYLVETYDKDEKITYTSIPEKYLLQQWSFYQASGQGPYFGQAAWFNQLHHEKLPSAQERYGKEILRVVGVLDSVLKDRDWLVGDKCTFADLSFVMWNVSIDFAMGGGPVEWNIEAFPHFKKWMDTMKAKPSVGKTLMTLQGTEVKSEGTQ